MEFAKFKRSRVLFPITLLPLFSVLYGSINYYFNKEILINEWISLWTQVYLFYGLFFYPCLVGIICAYSWFNEYKADGIKLLLTSSHSFIKIVFSKTAVVMGLLLLSQIYFLGLFYLSGRLFNFQMSFSLDFIKWLIIITLLSVLYVSVDMYISLKLKSFSITVIIGLLIGIFCFFGVTQNVFEELRYILASSLLSLEMNNNFVDISFGVMEWLKMIAYTLLFSGAALFAQVKYLNKIVK